MIRFLVYALCCSLLVLVGSASAQDISKADAPTASGDYAAAFAELQPLAERGDVDAQYNLAVFYRDGLGVSRDGEQAAKWYQRAAAGGSWLAALDLGMFYWGQSLTSDGSIKISDDALVRVHMWLGIAAATENAGCVAVGAPLRDTVAQSMSAEQIARAQERTRAWLAEHWKSEIDVAAAEPSC